MVAVGTLFIIYAKIANPKLIEEIEKETWDNFAQLCGSQENTRNGFFIEFRRTIILYYIYLNTPLSGFFGSWF